MGRRQRSEDDTSPMPVPEPRDPWTELPTPHDPDPEVQDALARDRVRYGVSAAYINDDDDLVRLDIDRLLLERPSRYVEREPAELLEYRNQDAAICELVEDAVSSPKVVAGLSVVERVAVIANDLVAVRGLFRAADKRRGEHKDTLRRIGARLGAGAVQPYPDDPEIVGRVCALIRALAELDTKAAALRRTNGDLLDEANSQFEEGTRLAEQLEFFKRQAKVANQAIETFARIRTELRLSEETSVLMAVLTLIAERAAAVDAMAKVLEAANDGGAKVVLEALANELRTDVGSVVLTVRKMIKRHRALIEEAQRNRDELLDRARQIGNLEEELEGASDPVVVGDPALVRRNAELEGRILLLKATITGAQQMLDAAS